MLQHECIEIKKKFYLIPKLSQMMSQNFSLSKLFGLFIIVLLSACSADKNTSMEKENSILTTSQNFEAPLAKKVEKKLEKHGDVRTDPYYWLNDREDQEVLDYLNAENDYLKKVMQPTDELQKSLFEEIKSRIKEEDSSPPYSKNGYFYYNRFEKGQEYPIYARKKGSLSAEEEILLNVNELAEGFSYYNVTGLNVSPDNEWLAYGVDTLSRRIYEIHIKNLITGETLKETIPNTTGGSTWANDNQTLFYSQKDETLRPYKIMKRKVNANKKSVVVFEETDPTFITYVYKTSSDKFVAIGSRSTLTTEHRFIPADQPDAPFTIFHPRERGLEYDIDHLNDQFYIHTNWNAENFKLMTCSVDQFQKEQWQELIPHREDVLLQYFKPFHSFLALSEREGGISKVKIWKNENNSHYIDFGEDAYTANLSVNEDPSAEKVRVQYTSMTRPSTVYDYHLEDQKLEMIKQQEVLGSFNPDDYQSERLMIKAQDGTEIPLSLVYKKGFEKDGRQPLMLYAYGSYGYSMEPYFSSVRLSLLDRGFAYAIAHIRGGQEMGRQWYEDGKLLKKKNTFTDFIDCAKGLVEMNYTSPEHLYAMGGSAGGLLMGAVINMEPQLFNGVIAAVPFVDVVTTMLDESIPLTTGEYDEWGNPNDSTYYAYIKSYSPYDNVKETDYPSLLVTTGLHDSQVQYWEPAKWVAKLRTNHTGKSPILLYTNMETGHGGASGRFERYKETAMEYAFLLNLENIDE